MTKRLPPLEYIGSKHDLGKLELEQIFLDPTIKVSMESGGNCYYITKKIEGPAFLVEHNAILNGAEVKSTYRLCPDCFLALASGNKENL